MLLFNPTEFACIHLSITTEADFFFFSNKDADGKYQSVSKPKWHVNQHQHNNSDHHDQSPAMAMVATIIMINEWSGRKQTSRGLEGSLACNYSPLQCNGVLVLALVLFTGISSGTSTSACLQLLATLHWNTTGTALVPLSTMLLEYLLVLEYLEGSLASNHLPLCTGVLVLVIILLMVLVIILLPTGTGASGGLHHCWSIANVFRARICVWYSPKGVYQDILSPGQYFPMHSLGSKGCIG